MKHAFVFMGFKDRLLGKSATFMTDMLADRGFTTTVFTGSRQDLFVRSSHEFSNADAIRDHMRSKVEASQYTLAIGASGGGYGGLLHSLYSGVDSYIGLSSLTTIDLESRKIDCRGEALVEPMKVVIPADRKRNLAFYLSQGAATTNIHLGYPVGNIYDAYHANNLKGFANVTLHPQQSDHHCMLQCSFSVPSFIDDVLEMEKSRASAMDANEMAS